MKTMYFKSNMDVKVRVLTYTICMILVLVSISLFVLFLRSEGDIYTRFSFLLIAFLLTGTAFYFYIQRVREIVYIADDKLILKKSFSSVTIPVGEITSIRKVNYNSIPMTFGSKGFFGFIGSTMDDYVSNVSNTSEMLAIETKSKKYLLSCQSSAELVSIMNNETKT